MSRLVIKVNWGGLGDHLFYSHLPRIAKMSGYKEVLISNLSPYRSPEYKDLIWGLNPYVDGFTNEDSFCPVTDSIPLGMNLLDWIMLKVGLDDGHRFHEPEVYYAPKIQVDLCTSLLYDPNYVSYVGDVSQQGLDLYVKTLLSDSRHILQMECPALGYPLHTDSSSIITRTSIFDYCSLIKSCSKFYCWASGGATLAAALGVRSGVFYGAGIKPMFLHSKLHRYIQV